MSRRLELRGPLQRRTPPALAVLAAAATAVACSSGQLPTSTAAIVEEPLEDPAGDRHLPPPTAEVTSPVTPQPPPEEPSIAGEARGPARRVLETAAAMYEESTVVRGSCYDYVSAVFGRAGFGGRRARETIFQGPRRGPYADLSLIDPGDWLYVVSYPDARPVGTHSVLFVRWQDRDAGRALVFSYVGGRADRSADLLTRDVSRTYAILRATERP